MDGDGRRPTEAGRPARGRLGPAAAAGGPHRPDAELRVRGGVHPARLAERGGPAAHHAAPRHPRRGPRRRGRLGRRGGSDAGRLPAAGGRPRAVRPAPGSRSASTSESQRQRRAATASANHAHAGVDRGDRRPSVDDREELPVPLGARLVPDAHRLQQLAAGTPRRARVRPSRPTPRRARRGSRRPAAAAGSTPAARAAPAFSATSAAVRIESAPVGVAGAAGGVAVGRTEAAPAHRAQPVPEVRRRGPARPAPATRPAARRWGRRAAPGTAARRRASKSGDTFDAVEDGVQELGDEAASLVRGRLGQSAHSLDPFRCRGSAGQRAQGRVLHPQEADLRPQRVGVGRDDPGQVGLPRQHPPDGGQVEAQLAQRADQTQPDHRGAVVAPVPRRACGPPRAPDPGRSSTGRSSPRAGYAAPARRCA